MNVSTRLAALGAVCAIAALPATAGAVTYPPPKKPAKQQAAPKGPFKTLKVCEKGKGCFKTIQQAVNKAKPGDTIRIAAGTYKEQVKISGKGKRFIKLIGNPKNPASVKLEGGRKFSNGVWVNGADGVTVNGMQAHNYVANGFFVVNVNGYTLTNLRALAVGVYGLYAFNSIGGTMSNSVAAYNNDSGFYVGQTPVQAKPVRTIIKNVVSYVNVLGYSGTNSRYVTITDSKFYNNGAGIVPNSLDSEKWPPNENNVFTRNEVFWNNFNYYLGAPFKARPTAVGNIPFPVGVGILVFGGRGNEVTDNKVFGNYLAGIALVPAITLKDPTEGVLMNNKVTGNVLGAGGQDLNAVDIAFPGGGSGNCFENNTVTAPNVPADAAAFPACTPNVPNPDNGTLTTMVDWATAENHEAHWVKNPHMTIAGITPVEHWTGGLK